MTPPKNPHLSLVALSPPCDADDPPRVWRCDYCGQIGTFEDFETSNCPYEHPPCNSCGKTPICATDCKGIAALLGLTPRDVN